MTDEIDAAVGESVIDAIIAWLREEAPVSIKLTMTPQQTNALCLRLAPAIRAAVLAERRACAEIARAKECEAAGDHYQTDKPGNFWDADSIYGKGRSAAADAILARGEK